ncbi:MAG: Glycerol-3-phosphate 1-O-acyltransferase [Bacteroidota bacterium]|jgi:glycerol-3-phosphate acyltransferase PlsY
MTFQVVVAIFCIVSYFLGSIPSAIWYGVKVFGVDIRTQGSGNAGATNTFRVFGKKAGTIVLILDAGKGFLATYFAVLVSRFYELNPEEAISLQILFGLLAIIGHLLPIFADFRGGKGVATLVGMVLCLNPLVALATTSVFLIVFLISHYVSLSAMLGAVAFPAILMSGYFGESTKTLIYFGIFVMFLVIYTHRKNIVRIREGKESKMYFIPKKKNSNS